MNTHQTAGPVEPPPSPRRRLLGYLRPVWVPFSASLAMMIAASALTAAKAAMIAPVVDRFQQGGTEHGDLVKLIILIGLVFGGQAIVSWLLTLTTRVASSRMVRDIRADLFGRLLSQSLGYFSERSSASLSSRVVHDLVVFEGSAIGSIQSLVQNLCTMAMLLGVLLIYGGEVAILCLVIVIIVGVLLRVMMRRVRVLALDVQENIGNVTHQIGEMIGGIEVILSFGLRKFCSERFDESNQSYYRAQLASTRVSATSVFLVQIIAASTIALILWVSGTALIQGRMTAGDFGAMMFALYLLQQPAMTIATAASNLTRGLAAYDRAVEILDDHPALVDPENPTPLVQKTGRIDFENVSFSYGDEPTLTDVTLSVEPNQLFVVVGDSGAGKSTVAKLAQRFYDPDRGRIRLDGIDLRDLARSDLYDAISYVAQEVFVFDATVEFNLRAGNPEASAEELAEAIRVACLGEVIAAMPEGLETKIGERGVRLSGGQRQRMAIARAVLAGTRIIVLDEATSAVDMELEQRILQNLVDTRRGRTILAITHRLSIADIADQVAVMKNGRLVELGTPAELGRTGTYYSRLQSAAAAGLGSSAIGARRRAGVVHVDSAMVISEFLPVLEAPGSDTELVAAGVGFTRKATCPARDVGTPAIRTRPTLLAKPDWKMLDKRDRIRDMLRRTER